MPAYPIAFSQPPLPPFQREVLRSGELSKLSHNKTSEFSFVFYLMLLSIFVFTLFANASLAAESVSVSSVESSDPKVQELNNSAAKPADIRVLIDVSGSMKQNDPRDLRRPAMDLLVQLFPEGSRAGVWTFGHYVNMLVPHTEVYKAWRDQAEKKSLLVNSVALHTNIGLALEKANYDANLEQFPKSAGYDRSVILLTDGMVDIDKDPALNNSERKRILNELLEEYKQAGVKIHTVALSAKADTSLLETLSLETDGVFAVAENAEDLNRVFLRAFDQAAPADRVPLADNAFLIDSSIEEFTALVFRNQGDLKTEVISPSQERLNADSDNPRLRWFASEAYDLITILQPDEGEWKINAPIDPENRVTVVSNLSLELAPLPNNLFLGQAMGLEARLLELGEPVVRQEFLDLITVEAQMARDHIKFWRQPLPNDSDQPGVYTRSLDMLQNEGDYSLTVVVDGKTFQREKTLNFSVRKPFRIELAANEEQGEYTITAVANDDSLKSDTVQIVGQLVLPDDREATIELMGQTDSVWAYQAVEQTSGDYRITLSAKGVNVRGEEVDYLIGEYALNLLVPGVAEPAAEPEPVVEPEPLPEPVPETEAAEAAPESEVPLVEEEESRWLLYTGLIAGNLLLIGLLYFIYRKFLAPPKEPEEAEETEEQEKEAVAEAEKELEVAAEPEIEAVEVPDQVAEESQKLPEESEDQVAAAADADEELTAAVEEPEHPAELEEPIDLESMLDVDESVEDIVEASGEETSADEEDVDVTIEVDELEALIAEAEAVEKQPEVEAGNSAEAADDSSVAGESEEADEDITIDLDGDFDLSTDITEEKAKQQEKGSG